MSAIDGAAGRLLITGASGFIGRRFLAALDRSSFREVTCLVRDAGALPGERVIVGRLEDPASYASALHADSTVVHLAAATGKAAPATYEAVNVEGTSRLVAACRQAGTRRFVFVSTIAAAYPDKRWYPYARSKAAAETIVRESGLDFLIVRPTIVLGTGSPAARSLGLLARPWLTVVPGDGKARVQPIDVDDLARVLSALATEERLGGETLGLGGPEAVPVGELLSRLSAARSGRRPRVIRLPLAPIVANLGRVEKVLLRVLPVTAGQLSAFANDGTVEPHPLLARWVPGFKRLDEMLGADLRDTAGDSLDAECVAFTRYLCGQAPTDYVRLKYREAHARLGALGGTLADPFDAVLLRLARRPGLTRLADAYARAFAVRSRVRVKLIVLLAILESCEPTHHHFDGPDACGAPRLVLRAASHAIRSALALLGAVLVLRPLHFFWRRGPASAGA